MVVVGLPYTCSPVYRFPAPTPFHGARFYNPYEHLLGRWQRANLHAHGQAWGGLTNGEQASAHVVHAYKALGYDVAGVSNYHSIAAHHGIDTLPLYEHGYNIRKRHQLAIGARDVDWLDFPVWQSLNQAQYIIDRMARTADLVGLTHPDARRAYTADDLTHLTGYHYIEVVNGPFESTAPWDAALSSGHAVWAMANDDTHDVDDPRRLAAAWNMIDAASTHSRDVIPALRAGRAIAVARGPNEAPAVDVTLTGLTLVDGTMSVTTAGALSEIEFVGERGASRAKAVGVHHATYTFTPQDPYIRVVVRTPQTTMFLNPVVRHDGDGHPAAPVAVVDPVWTWALHLGSLAAVIGTTVWLWPVRRRTPAASDRAPRLDSPQETD